MSVPCACEFAKILKNGIRIFPTGIPVKKNPLPVIFRQNIRYIGKIINMRHRLMILGMLTLLLCACDPGHVFNYYLCNHTQDTIVYDTIYKLPPNAIYTLIDQHRLGQCYDYDDIERYLSNTPCFCPIEFKDGSRIQYCRDDSLPKSIYKSYSDYNCHQKRNSYHTTIYYYVTEEDHQQALKYGSR